jgi:large subunit ribosomal protein L21
MKYAIVENGGKQYKVVEGTTVEVDLMPTEVGEHIDLEQVLLFVDGDEVKVGAPDVPGAKVLTTVVAHVKGPKIIIFKYKPKKRIRVKTGHRQQYTRLMVNSIELE